jgi:hypothetical protein
MSDQVARRPEFPDECAFHSADRTKNVGEPGAGNSGGYRPGAARTLKPPYLGQFWTQVDTRLAVALDGRREPFLHLLFSIPLTVWFALVYPAWAWPILAMNPPLACVSFTSTPLATTGCLSAFHTNIRML